MLVEVAPCDYSASSGSSSGKAIVTASFSLQMKAAQLARRFSLGHRKAAIRSAILSI
jgi:hypothetical protein